MKRWLVATILVAVSSCAAGAGFRVGQHVEIVPMFRCPLPEVLMKIGENLTTQGPALDEALNAGAHNLCKFSLPYQQFVLLGLIDVNGRHLAVIQTPTDQGIYTISWTWASYLQHVK